MRIPPKELIREMILKVLGAGIARSQRELALLVERELLKLDKEYVLTPRRARRIALDTKGVDVLVRTKSSGGEKPKKCPACSSKLHGLYARNLLGKRVLIALKCERCGYHGDVLAFAPAAYEFRIK